jgi:uncharacterized protein (TIGR00730 family)
VSRRSTADDDERASLTQLLDEQGVIDNRDLVLDLLESALRIGRQRASRLDLKIAAAALREMGRAFAVFAPYHDVPKVTIFGSARTMPTDPAYHQARELAGALARSGWMVVTGAGPGIMAAGAEGAGPTRSLGVNIRLPFEQQPSPSLLGDGPPRLVEMRYFFTRKLMLLKESAGFAALPGGFGTLDETFELFTLLQTGKAEPAPVVLLDSPGEHYWIAWKHFVVQEVIERGLAAADDAALYLVTDDVGTAVTELLGFYRNYHSRRFVGSTMVIRLRHAPSDDALALLNEEFKDCCDPRGIWRTEPLGPERADRDRLELARIALIFDRQHSGRLRALIDAVNRLAPPRSSEAARSPGRPPSAPE